MAKKKTSETDLKTLVATEISAARTAMSDLAEKRSQALEYYYGTMRDTPAPPNRSKMVRRIVAETIDKMMPAIVRTFLASGRIVEYEPQGPEDEEAAEQASDLATHVFMKDNNGYQIIYDASFDALLHGDGIVKCYWDDYEDSKVEEYTGIDEMVLAELTGDPAIEILNYNVTEDAGGWLYDVKVKRIKSKGKICIEVVPPEDFLIDDDATDVEDARFVAHRGEYSKSELIEMGFDRKLVESLPSDRQGTWSEIELSRDESAFGASLNTEEASKLVELYECYIKTDLNDDGIAETVKVYYAGAGEGGEVLDWEEWEGDHPFNAIPCEPVPHRWDSQSIAEKLMDLQQLSTLQLRAALDNVYSHANPQPIVVENSVVNKDSLTNPKFGQPIIVRKGQEKPIEWRDTPFVAGDLFAALEYTDKMVIERTGMSGMASALDPETLQNQSATAAQLQHDIQYSRAELIARNMAEGWRKVMRRVLKLMVANQDRAKVIRLRGEWIPMDPRSWNADMDCTVNVGLGTGSRDRDMAMLNTILQSQYAMTQAAASYGIGFIALEMLPKITNTLVKMGEAAGIRNADDYYVDFSPEKLQQIQQQLSQPREDPKIALEQQKLQLEMQKMQSDAQISGYEAQLKKYEVDMKAGEGERKLELERMKVEIDTQAKLQVEQAKLEANVAKERAQMEADIMVEREKMRMEYELRQREIEQQAAIQREQASKPKSFKVTRGKDGKAESFTQVNH